MNTARRVARIGLAREETVIYHMEKATGSLEVLVRLYTTGACGKTELSRDLGPGYETVAKTLERMEQLGLVTATNESRFPFKQVYVLSDQGRRLVETPLSRWPGLFREVVGPEMALAEEFD